MNSVTYFGARGFALFLALCAAGGCDSGFRTVAPTPSPRTPAVQAPAQGHGPAAFNPLTIALGQRVDGAVQAADPDCFSDWDARGRCRSFELIVGTDGKLVATLTGTGPTRGMDNTEIFIVGPDGKWAWSGEGWPERRVDLAATGGLVYRVVVISYGPFPDAFALMVDLQ